MVKKVKRDFLGVVVWGVVLLIIIIGMAVKFGIEKAQADEVLAKYPDRGVPRMNITLNGVSLEEINEGSKNEKYEGNWLTVYDGGDVAEYEDVRVKGRGNGTWVEEKKPYQIKFSHKVDMFGMGKAKKWVLLANVLDATNLRTATAFYLERMLEMKPAFAGEFVELYVDNEYIGLYYLTHAVDIGKTSVDLRDPMGVLVELDNMYGSAEDYYSSKNGDKLVLKDVVDESNAEKAMEFFVEDYNQLEEAMEEDDFKQIEKIIDVKSFAQYYLLSEFSVNPDAYWTSFYMYKDGFDDKIHAGPGWDFDLAFANRIWGNWLGEVFYSPRETMVRERELISSDFREEKGDDWYELSSRLTRVVFDLAKMPGFQKEVKRLYLKCMQNRKDELILSIEENAKRIKEAVSADVERWGLEDHWKDIEKMEQWISERYDYFDEIYADKK